MNHESFLRARVILGDPLVIRPKGRKNTRVGGIEHRAIYVSKYVYCSSSVCLELEFVHSTHATLEAHLSTDL